jgi:hypothetical protein
MQLKVARTAYDRLINTGLVNGLGQGLNVHLSSAKAQAPSTALTVLSQIDLFALRPGIAVAMAEGPRARVAVIPCWSNAQYALDLQFHYGQDLLTEQPTHVRHGSPDFMMLTWPKPPLFRDPKSDFISWRQIMTTTIHPSLMTEADGRPFDCRAYWQKHYQPVLEFCKMDKDEPLVRTLTGLAPSEVNYFDFRKLVGSRAAVDKLQAQIVAGFGLIRKALKEDEAAGNLEMLKTGGLFPDAREKLLTLKMLLSSRAHEPEKMLSGKPFVYNAALLVDDLATLAEAYPSDPVRPAFMIGEALPFLKIVFDRLRQLQYQAWLCFQ